jgi:hypothetical protein
MLCPDFGSYINGEGGGWAGLNWYIFSFMLVTQVGAGWKDTLGETDSFSLW